MRISDWSSDVCSSDLRLDQVLADVGDHVKKGQLLARYDDAGLRADLANLDALVAEAQANLQKAEADAVRADQLEARSEEHTSELQSLMRISYAVFCLKKKNKINTHYS